MNNRIPPHACYGDATDGNVTLGSNITLARDMQYDTLDLAGFNIDTAGYRLRCRKLLNTGGACTISRNGGSPAGTTPVSMTASVLGKGSNGGTGATGAANGSPGSARGNCWSRTRLGGTAGAGGQGGNSGGGQTGGAAGTVTAVAASQGEDGPASLFDGVTISSSGSDTGNGAVGTLHGGGGGGGGASTASCSGGAGGTGGGVVCVWARYVNAPSVTISANGGNGANGAGAGAGGGGGSGGGGGTVQFVYNFAGTLPTLTANGGTGGTPVGTGTAGANGNAGDTITRRIG